MTPWQLRKACNIIRHGGIIAYPTEAVFGLGCDPLDFDAVQRICGLKQRSLAKGLILIASGIDQVRPYVEATPAQLARLEKKTATPVTWIMPAHSDCPPWLTGEHSGIAVRIITHPVARRLCQQLGHALVSTSANISTRPAARTALDVRRVFNGDIDMILNDACGLHTRPSQIRDIVTNRVLRK